MFFFAPEVACKSTKHHDGELFLRENPNTAHDYQTYGRTITNQPVHSLRQVAAATGLNIRPKLETPVYSNTILISKRWRGIQFKDLEIVKQQAP